MSKANIITLSIIIIIAIGIVGYAGFQSYSQNSQDNETTQEDATSTESDVNIERINAKHQYDADEGQHIIAGTLQTPTICHLLETSAEVDEETDPETATIDFDLVNTSETCAQQIGEARFKVEFEAPENATIEANLNGEPVELNLIPADEDEDLSDFEIFIKG